MDINRYIFALNKNKYIKGIKTVSMQKRYNEGLQNWRWVTRVSAKKVINKIQFKKIK